MAIGLYEGEQSDSEKRDEAFICCVEEHLGRNLTMEEEEVVFACRDQQGYSGKECAVEITSCSAEA